ncbi:hypothetical protein BGZ92_001417, partial [Podila epicladia]
MTLSLPPDLLREISLFLDEPHDLTQCSLVNKSWSAVFIPCVWRSITITTIWAYRRFFSPEAQAAFLKHAHLVRELRTIYIPVVERIIQISPGSDPSSDDSQVSCLCTNLTTLNLRVFWRTSAAGDASAYSKQGTIDDNACPGYALTPDQELLVLHLVKSNPSLRNLCIGGYIKDRDRLMAAITDTSLPHLQHLDLFRHLSRTDALESREMTRQFLLNCPRTLQNLSLDITHFWDPDRQSIVQPPVPHVLLESLSVTSSQEDHMLVFNELLDDFIKSCSSRLRDLYIGEPGQYKPLQSALEEIGSGFGREIRPEWYRYTNPDETFSQRLAQADDWTYINLTSNPGKEGRLTAKSLLERCGQLKILNVGQCAHLFDSRIFHEILGRSANLIELRAAMEDSPRLDAMDFTGAWGCKSLKIFDVAIVNVPRPDITTGYDGRPIAGELFRGTKEESRNVQRRIFGQLAELKDLEVLILGKSSAQEYWKHRFFNREDATGKVRFFDPDFQFSCLDMSLDSGMYLLSELTEMRVLDVTGIAHRIGVR